MTEKYNLLFAINNLKKAIFKLECVNKLNPNTVDVAIINELKSQLILLKNEREKVS
jgi:hypothetical protein